jgi:signal transduction histidine kinase
MTFVILPPVAQRWWFRGSVFVGVILIVLAGHRYRVARLLALERVRMRIAADLHDDIGGSLSRISIQSEVACRETEALGERPRHRLAEIADHARTLVDALSDVVWSVDPGKDDLASVCRRIREYADDVLASNGVRWTYTSSPNLESVKLDPQARRALFLLLKEAVTNAARHARARSVSLNVELAGRELRAELTDDGCGFDRTGSNAENTRITTGSPACAREPNGSALGVGIHRSARSIVIPAQFDDAWPKSARRDRRRSSYRLLQGGRCRGLQGRKLAVH